MRFPRLRFVLQVIALCASLSLSAQSTPVPSQPLPITYTDTQYGFCFSLPASWKGYSAIKDTWEAGPVGNVKGPVIQGPKIVIRHPKWTEAQPYQDIPIMILTIAQWKLAESNESVFSAAPVGPGEIGRNATYVFATPPRWIGYTDDIGWQELENFMSSHPFHAPCTAPTKHLK